MFTPPTFPATTLARWFVTEYLGRSWQEAFHKKQNYAAQEILDSATPEQVKACLRAMARGTLPSQKGQPGRAISLLYLAQPNPHHPHGLTLLEEYQKVEAYQKYLNRPAMQEFRAASETFFFSPPEVPYVHAS